MTLANAMSHRVASEASSKQTSRLLTCGVLAGPIYIVVVAVQALTRPGFDITRHAASLLSNGDLGWIQITNFLVTGALVIACAVGMWRVLHTRASFLIGTYGASLIAAGVFVADPALGFPPGVASPEPMSWHSLLHFVAGAVGFLALIVGCFVFARRFASAGERGWAAFSLLTGIVFFAGFAGIASGGGQPAFTIAFTLAVILAWTWLSTVSAHLIRQASA
jgi:hypothetical membrane protein